MFDDLFGDPQEDYSPAAANNQYQRRPRTCAHHLDIPDKQRVAGTPVGLKNQGCTCYLNSLLQILFFTPEFRNVIYSIPLFKSTLEEPTGYLDQQSKTKFVLGFQELFTEMQLLDCKSVGTTNLNDAFGWNAGQQAEQHDINESMIVILETLERALKKTDFEGQIRDSFKIIVNKYIKCMNCAEQRDRDPEEVFQLLTYVKDKSSLHEGITSLLTPEVVEGVECQSEGSKQSAQIGQTIHTLPEVLVITLGRFDFDYNTFQRVKLTSELTFDLEINMGQYLQNPDEKNYELYGVLIHGGSAHSGHYIAYIRDIMQESDWNNSYLIQQMEEEREKANRKVQETVPKSKPSQEAKKDSGKLKEPTNPELLKNWYELNDSCVTPIEASKIATQFQGAMCAYILFYRKVAIAQKAVVSPPEYLKVQVEEKNKIIREKREHFEVESSHIHIILNGETYRTNTNETLGSFLERHCPKGSCLVNKEEMNDLPYYPIYLSYSQDLSQTLVQLDLVHESKWVVMPEDSEEFKELRDLVGIQKVPVTLTILFQNQIYILPTHIHRTLLELRFMLQQKFNVGYSQQVIKLLNDYGKQIFLTDNPDNDQSTLAKLNFKNLSQINLNYIKPENDQAQPTANIPTKLEAQKQNLGILSFALERDDSPGIKRYYIKETMTLQEAFDHFKKAENITDEYKRRLRWTNRNRLFSGDQYTKPLSEFPFEESIIKVKIQRGEIPIKGDICVRVKNQSKYLVEGEEGKKTLEIMQDPNQTLKKLKEEICEAFNLDPSQHKMYRTDWLEEPTRPIIKETQTLFEANFSMQQLIILRDIDSKLAAQLLHLNLYITKTGFPDDCERMLTFTTEETKTLQEVKENLLTVPLVAELLGDNPSPKRIRLREVKRNYMFGTIFRNHNKTLKGNGLEDFNVVVQVLGGEEELAEGDIVLATRHRDSVNRLYLDQTEFIFKASKAPTLKELKEAFLGWKGLEVPEDELRLFKYYLHDLEWVEWSDKLYQKWMDMREKNSKMKLEQKAKQKQNAKKNREENSKKKQSKKDQQSKEEEGKPKAQETPSNQQLSQGTNETPVPAQQTKDQIVNEPKPENKQKQKKPKESQGKKKGDKEQGKDPQEQNLRKVPFLLKDGDILGFGFNSEMIQGDDLQTEQDDNLRILQSNERKKVKGGSHKHVKQNPFQFILDF